MAFPIVPTEEARKYEDTEILGMSCALDTEEIRNKLCFHKIAALLRDYVELRREAKGDGIEVSIKKLHRRTRISIMQTHCLRMMEKENQRLIDQIVYHRDDRVFVEYWDSKEDMEADLAEGHVN